MSKQQKEKQNGQPKFLCHLKISFTNEDETKKFSNKQ